MEITKSKHLYPYLNLFPEDRHLRLVKKLAIYGLQQISKYMPYNQIEEETIDNFIDNNPTQAQTLEDTVAKIKNQITELEANIKPPQTATKQAGLPSTKKKEGKRIGDGAVKPSNYWRKGDANIYEKPRSPKKAWAEEENTSMDSVDLILAQKVDLKSLYSPKSNYKAKKCFNEPSVSKPKPTANPDSMPIKKYKQTHFHNAIANKQPSNANPRLRNVESKLKDKIQQDKQRFNKKLHN